MAGLLDSGNWFTGDDTVKDQFGQTQADRREPLWSGLIQGGMGLLAASQDLTPQARAQMMVQAGQAYGGIPAAMRAQTSAAAQQMLQGQQIKAGQAKLDAGTRLAALAKTPEFQAAVAKLEPEERMLLQASLDAGDMAHAQEILTGAARTRAAQAEVLRKEKRDDAKVAADEKKAEGVNTFGKDPAAVAWNNLQHYPPDSPQYAAAWEFLTREQKDAAGNTISPKIDLGKYGYKEPEHRAPGAPPVAADGTVTPPAVAPAATPPAATPPPPPPAVVPPGSLPPFVVPGGAVPPAPPPVVPPAGPAVPPPAPPVVAPTPPVPPPAVVPPAEAQAQADPVKFGWTLPKSQSFTRSDGVTVSRDTQGGVLVETPDAGAKYYEKEGRAPKIYPRVAVPEKQAGVLKGATYGLDSIDILEKELANNKVLVGQGGRLVKGVGDVFGAGDAALNAGNPEGRRARTLIAALASGKIKEMSGAAVSPAEFTRLDQFLPKAGDDLETIKTKLIDLKRELQNMGNSEFRTLPPGTMYNPDEKRRFGTKSPAAETPKVKRYNKDTGEFE